MSRAILMLLAALALGAASPAAAQEDYGYRRDRDYGQDRGRAVYDDYRRRNPDGYDGEQLPRRDTRRNREDYTPYGQGWTPPPRDRLPPD